MKKRGKITFLGGVVTLVILIALIHTSMHLMIYGTGIDGLAKEGVPSISGLAIGNIKIDETLKTSYPQLPRFSQFFIIAEWALLIALLIFTLLRQRINLRSEMIGGELVKKYTGSKTKTDLDILYDILKEKKKIRLSTIEKIFKVDKETVKEWCKIFESNNLATVNYPKMGEAELAIN